MIFRFYISFFILLSFWNLSAQIFRPVQWISEQKKISKDEYDLLIKAHIEKNWHIYSIHSKIEDIGIPVSVNFKEDKTHYEKIGLLQEIGQLKQQNIYELGISYKFINDKVLYKQRIHSISPNPFEIRALLEFQPCSSINCLALDRQEFYFYINEEQKALKKS